MNPTYRLEYLLGNTSYLQPASSSTLFVWIFEIEDQVSLPIIIEKYFYDGKK